jgi:RND family efflux transporter MFP subunit
VTRIPRLVALIASFGLCVLSGCKREQAQETPPIRPVLSVVITADADRKLGFTGTVEPRYTTDLGFRDLGRLIARNVEVGDSVRAGAVIAAIDPLQFQLAVKSAIADVSTTRAKQKNTSGAESRQGILLNQGVTPQSQYDSAQLARETATASVRCAEANLVKAQEQLKYATLRSDTDGVVTAVSGQVG